MNTVHLPKNVTGDMKYAAVGLFFSEANYTKEGVTDEMVNTIDEFFESLSFNDGSSSVVVPVVTYGKIMMMADMDNRWVYKGSVTTPPCDTFVYWNVIRRVHPIKKRHLDRFKEVFKIGGLEKTGNYRMVMPLDDHDPHVITTETNKKADIMDFSQVKVLNNKDGSVSVAFNASDGSNTIFTPKMDGSYGVQYRDEMNRSFTWSTTQDEWTIPSIEKNFTSDNDKSGAKYMLGTQIKNGKPFAALTVPKKGNHYYSFPQYNLYVSQ